MKLWTISWNRIILESVGQLNKAYLHMHTVCLYSWPNPELIIYILRTQLMRPSNYLRKHNIGYIEYPSLYIIAPTGTIFELFVNKKRYKFVDSIPKCLN